MRKCIPGLCLVVPLLGFGVAGGAEDDLFTKLDANKDGYVGLDEVEGDRRALFERMLRSADKDSDKRLSKDEFQAGLKETEEPRRPLAGGEGRPGGGIFDPRQVFERNDANKDGKLSKDEAPERMKENFDRMDADSDGFVSSEEFVRAAARFGGGPREPSSGDRQRLEDLFNRTDANSDGKVTRDEMPEDRRERFGRILERIGGDSLDKEQFVRALLMELARQVGEPAPGDGPRLPPVMVALDANRDGELSSEEIEGAAKALKALDKNEDGKLTREELGPPGGPVGRLGDRPREGRPEEGRPGERRGQFNPEEFHDRLVAADANKDGKLSKDEAPDFLQERFDRIDANSDGVLDVTEIKQMMERMRQARPEGRRPEGDRAEEAKKDEPKN